MKSPLTPVLGRLFSSSADDAIAKILQIYGTNGYVLVNFLYFANIVLNRLDEDDKEATHAAYELAILASDLLLPDGIALELLARRRLGKRLTNLNGTDFIPKFLREVSARYKVRIFLYGGPPEVVPNAAEYVRSTFGLCVPIVIHGYASFDWGAVEECVKPDDDTINVLLVGRGSPRQEVWMEENREQIRQHNCIAFAVGGLLDFW